MPELVVIVPSRGRPEKARAFVQAFADTRTVAHLVFAIDEDDPTRDEYAALLGEPVSAIDTGGLPATMVRALNASAIKRATSDDPPFAVAFMGDDHMPRTFGWDAAYLEALRELGTGMVYGNDLLQGGKLPTQVAVTADIVRALGYMAPPALTHLYVDNFWLDLGRAAGCIQYLPDVIVEHRHPVAGKAQWDEGYRRVNDATMYDRDHAAYQKYLAESFAADVAKVQALRHE